MSLPRAIQFRKWIFLFLLLGAGFGLTGCGSTEAANTSSKPWNSPEGWQSGVPGQMLNGR
jgi:hypothetical protein